MSKWVTLLIAVKKTFGKWIFLVDLIFWSPTSTHNTHTHTHIHTCTHSRDQETTISVLIERCNLANGSHETFRERVYMCTCARGYVCLCVSTVCVRALRDSLWDTYVRMKKKNSGDLRHLLSSPLLHSHSHHSPRHLIPNLSSPLSLPKSESQSLPSHHFPALALILYLSHLLLFFLLSSPLSLNISCLLCPHLCLPLLPCHPTHFSTQSLLFLLLPFTLAPNRWRVSQPLLMFFYAPSYLSFFYVCASLGTSVTPNNISQDRNDLLCVAVKGGQQWGPSRGGKNNKISPSISSLIYFSVAVFSIEILPIYQLIASVLTKLQRKTRTWRITAAVLCLDVTWLNVHTVIIHLQYNGSNVMHVSCNQRIHEHGQVQEQCCSRCAGTPTRHRENVPLCSVWWYIKFWKIPQHLVSVPGLKTVVLPQPPQVESDRDEDHNFSNNYMLTSMLGDLCSGFILFCFFFFFLLLKWGAFWGHFAHAFLPEFSIFLFLPHWGIFWSPGVISVLPGDEV